MDNVGRAVLRRNADNGQVIEAHWET